MKKRNEKALKNKSGREAFRGAAWEKDGSHFQDGMKGYSREDIKQSLKREERKERSDRLREQKES